MQLVNRGAKERKRLRQRKKDEIRRYKRQQKLAKKTIRNRAITYENKTILN